VGGLVTCWCLNPAAAEAHVPSGNYSTVAHWQARSRQRRAAGYPASSVLNVGSLITGLGAACECGGQMYRTAILKVRFDHSTAQSDAEVPN